MRQEFRSRMDSNDLADGKLHVFVSMGKYHRDEDSLFDMARKRWTMLCVRSISKTTPNVVIHFIFCNLYDDFLDWLAILAKQDNPTCEILFEFMSREQILSLMDNAEPNAIGPHSAVRLVLHDLYPDVDYGIWLDNDTIVRENLWNFVEDARAALDGTGYFCAGAVESYDPSWYANAGVLFVDFKWLREHPYTRENLRRVIRDGCNDDVPNDKDAPGINKKMYDQAILNAFGIAKVDKAWNTTVHNLEFDITGTKESTRNAIERAKIVHFTGMYKSDLFVLSRIPVWSFIKDAWDEVESMIPGLVQKYRLGYKPRPIERRHGGKEVPLNLYLTAKYPGYEGDVINVVTCVSGHEYIRKHLPTCAYSLAKTCSKRVVFHIAYTADSVDDWFFGLIDRLGSILSKYNGFSFKLHEVPDYVLDEITVAGDRERETWHDHLIRAYLQDFMTDLDIVAIVDLDMLFQDDFAEVMDYCMSHGLGRDVDCFLARNPNWREFLFCEVNQGLDICSFEAFRRKGVSREASKCIVYGPYTLMDEFMSYLYETGVLDVGWLPYQYHAVASVFEQISILSNGRQMAYDRLDKLYQHYDAMPVDGNKLPVYGNGRPLGHVIHFAGLKYGRVEDADDDNHPAMKWWDGPRHEIEGLLSS